MRAFTRIGAGENSSSTQTGPRKSNLLNALFYITYSCFVHYMMLWSIRSISIYICMSTETISNSIIFFNTRSCKQYSSCSISESDLGTS